ncbi:DEAD/DEAH box helicase [Naasia lichenicola]|uniref:DEAD/DEAH box helicase n=1 Tax=Naasia lichenicola TaxID=2565933 RepID=A0A4S4FS73_9MICO|nr:DEAD/DEAH box helicase [Naasia lichenicola]THG33141.1 DEAD/DEAH box helicase [Naasia lichenicola]
MTAPHLFDPTAGTSAAEHLSPSFPERAAWGTAGKLRAWQEEALTAYFDRNPRDFLAAATPGAGKTTFALRLAKELLARREIDRITVVAPTEHLKQQWAEAADKVAIHLDPVFRNRDKWQGRHYHGVAVTYAQVVADASVHRAMTDSARTLVILDEVHHGGDALSWGDAIRESFETATRRLSLSGTPFRSDTAAIPFVEYVRDNQGIRVSRTDYAYGYGRALEDGVVRPVIFMVYAGLMRWKSGTGEDMEAKLGEGNTKDITSQAWRTALDPSGDWIPAVLAAADQRLTEVRQGVPDAGGLVIATDQFVARAYAKILENICGEEVTIVLSDEKAASERISEYSKNTKRWMVAVRMVSEGVDVPRLAVGVYATSSSTPLFFAQAVGRFVRARRRGETASIFLPNVPSLMGLANSMEVQRDHALDRMSTDDGLDDSLLESANRSEKASDLLQAEFEFQAVSSDATFDRVLYEGGEFGFEAEVGSMEELDFLGIPGLLEPDEVRELLQHRQQRQEKRRKKTGEPKPVAEGELAPAPMFRNLKEQRSLLNSLVGLWAKTSGDTHPMVHAELRRICGGPPVAQASVTQLQSRIELLRKRMAGH